MASVRVRRKAGLRYRERRQPRDEKCAKQEFRAATPCHHSCLRLTAILALVRSAGVREFPYLLRLFPATPDGVATIARCAMRRRLLLLAAPVVVVAGGLVAGGLLLAVRQQPDPGKLDTKLSGVSYEGPASPGPAAPTRRRRHARLPYHLHSRAEQPCWLQFGGSPERTLARVDTDLGPPTRPLWARGLDGYIEYPPVYCDGLVYVNTYKKGTTYAVDSETGEIIWRRDGGRKPSSPAIDGRRLLVSDEDGSVTAYDRFTGRRLWRVHTGALIESSPALMAGTVYVGNRSGRVYAIDTRSGRVRWAFDTGGRINSSPTVVGGRVCVTNYAGAIFCLQARNGHKLWSTYFKRDAFRYDSFYASASTDGRRLYSIARSGKVVAVSLDSGRHLWSRHIDGWGYSTPAVARGRVFVGGFDGALHAYDARTGDDVWSSHVGGRILGAPVVIGPLVFFATLETDAYAVRAADGKRVWHWAAGKYSPVIATNRHYYMSLNGLLVAFRGERSPLECNPNERHALVARERRACRRLDRAARLRRSAQSQPPAAGDRGRRGASYLR
jgi:outer membrane protein assembly factor BamB